MRRPYLDELRLANQTSVNVWLGVQLGVSDGAAVSPTLGFPYILDQAVIQVGAPPGGGDRFGLDIRVADDPDLTDLNNLSGELIWSTGLDLVGGEPARVHIDYRQPIVLEPARLVRRSPTYLKVRWSSLVNLLPYGVLFTLVPLPDEAL